MCIKFRDNVNDKEKKLLNGLQIACLDGVIYI